MFQTLLQVGGSFLRKTLNFCFGPLFHLFQSLKPLIALSSVNASLYNSGVSQRSVSLSNALADDVHDPFVTQCIERCDVGDQNSLPRSPPDRRRSNVEDQDLSAENALSACAFQYQSEASSCAFFRNAQR